MGTISTICLIGACALIVLSLSACDLLTPPEPSITGTQPPAITPAGEEGDGSLDENEEAENIDIGLDELFGNGDGITPPAINP